MQNNLTNKIFMSTTGITIKHNAEGIPTFAHIDLRKYGEELKNFFITKGISVESPYNQEFVKKINRSEQQIKEGKFHTLDLDNLWK